jgi:hypothetical protein
VPDRSKTSGPSTLWRLAFDRRCPLQASGPSHSRSPLISRPLAKMRTRPMGRPR